MAENISVKIARVLQMEERPSNVLHNYFDGMEFGDFLDHLFIRNFANMTKNQFINKVIKIFF